jgi:hypothetical protein
MDHIKLALLKPTPSPLNLPLPNFPGHPGILSITQPTIELPSLLESGGIHEIWSLDFETNGDYGTPGSYAVGVGLASPRGSVYIPISSSHPDTLRVLAANLAQRNIRLIAHNLFFDAGWFMRDVSQSFGYRDGLGSKEPGAWLNWHACTYALYRLLASEGYPGQQYGLKKAQVDLLGWESSNELLLDCWLIENEHVGNVSRVPKEGYYFYPGYATGSRTYAASVPEVPGENDRFVSPRKEAMHLAPPDILGTYCRLDAVSTLDLYTHVLSPALDKFEGLQWYMHELYMRFLYLLVWQKVSGVAIHQDALDAHRVSLETKITSLKAEFLKHPEVATHIAAYNQSIVDEHKAKEPKRIKGIWPPNSPATTHKKDGSPTAAYLTYQAKLEAGPEISLNWVKWSDKRSELSGQNQFNLNSGQQKAWLLYESMCYPVRSTTESGQPSTDDTALKHFGEPGRLLSSYVEAEKELGFNQSIRNVMDTGASRYHPSFRVPGTHTGRLSGSGGFNFQNLPKSLDYLKAFTVEEGYVIVTCDHASLEDYVLAELSRDASLWDFYAVGRMGNCMYLSVGSRLPVLGEKIREAGYDPDNWTVESVKAAKKTASKWRQIAKKIVLSCIAEGTLVRVKDKGYMPIEKITKDMLVWDGAAWVNTDGAMFMGEKECMNLNGNWMT